MKQSARGIKVSKSTWGGVFVDLSFPFFPQSFPRRRESRLLPKLCLALTLTTLGITSLLIPNIPTSAITDSSDLDVSVLVEATVQLSQKNCDNNPNINLMSLSTSLTSPFASNCQILSINANTPGYSLSVKAVDDRTNPPPNPVTNAMVYDDPYSGTRPTIPATSNSLTAPNVLSSGTWGFAATSSNVSLTGQPIDGFQPYANYSPNNATNTYAALTTSDTVVYSSNQLPAQTDQFTFYYGVKVDAFVTPGQYSTNIIYTLIGERVPCQWDNSIEFDSENCVEPTPLPAGVTAANAPSTIDIYPTTGWEADSIALMSDNQFNNVTNVTIDSTACLEYNVYNPSLIACKLPAKPVGTKAAISVTTSSTNIDMNGLTVQYFDPNRTELIGTSQSDHTTFDTFTTTDCAAMTRTSGQNDGQIVYLTDTRNNQTYPVRKMADDKCWMIDNMKYLGEGLTITNVDGTTGIYLRDATHKGTGGNTFNTVDGANSQSTANFDKAFYNTPMTNSYCYGSGAAYSARTVTTTGCGYFYNWYAATAGTGTYSLSTSGATASASICPAGTHLPSAHNGSSYTEFAILNASMNAGNPTAASTGTTYYGNWQPGSSFSGVFSGYWGNSLNGISSNSRSWSSSAYSSSSARSMYFNSSSSVSPGNNDINKYYGLVVRCVVD